MSAKTASERVEKVAQSVIDALWIQWAGLGASIEAENSPRSVVDPEALLITSMLMRGRERRLWDSVVSFARDGSNLLSVQRVKNLIGRFPDSARSLVADFATLAWSQGSDFRWKTLESGRAPAESRDHELWRAYPARWSSSALLLRLRLAFGVGIAADLLGYLLSLRGDWATAMDIALAVDYSVRPVRRSADNLAAAKMIATSRHQPTEYRVDANRWAFFLEVEDKLPAWRYWSRLYLFIAHVLAAAGDGEWGGLSTYVLSSRVSDLVEEHEQALRFNRLNVPVLRGASPEQALAESDELLDKLARWLMESA